MFSRDRFNLDDEPPSDIPRPYKMPKRSKIPPLHWTSPIYERTLAIIKPDAMQFRDAIVRRIKHAGFKILGSRIVKLTMEQATEFYKNTCDMDGCTASLMVSSLSSGPIQAMVLCKYNAVGDWIELMGPESYAVAKLNWPGCLRAIFADPQNQYKNAVHGSAHEKVAKHEIHFFFPNMILEPILNEKDQGKFLQAAINPVLMDGLHAMNKARPEDPLDFLAHYLMAHNPGKPHFIDCNDVTLQKINDLEQGESMRSCDSEFDVSTFASEIDMRRPIAPAECDDKESMITLKPKKPKPKPPVEEPIGEAY